jgi:hypothetical protein
MLWRDLPHSGAATTGLALAGLIVLLAISDGACSGTGCISDTEPEM